MGITLGGSFYSPHNDQPHFRRFQPVLNLGKYFSILFETFFEIKKIRVTFGGSKLINFRLSVKTNPVSYDFVAFCIVLY